MAKEWAPSWWGQHLPGSSDWRLRLDGPNLTLTISGRAHWVNVEEEATYRIRSGAIWTDITFQPGQSREVKADGLPNGQGAALVQALNVALTETRQGRRIRYQQPTTASGAVTSPLKTKAASSMSWSGATWPNASARELVGFRLLAVDGKWERVDGVEHLIASRLHDMTSLLGMLETR